MAKEITGYIKLQIPAGAASPSPPVGPALGQRGVNIMEFCKAFNAKTQQEEKGSPIPVVITVYKDRSFSFAMKKPPASYYLKKAAGVPKGSSAPGKESAGQVSMEDIRKIAEQKMENLNADTLEGAVATILGSARAMGLKVLGGEGSEDNLDLASSSQAGPEGSE